MSYGKIFSYRDLQNQKYDGKAWNVYYEYFLDDECWGHDGEYVDELDAWFLDFESAQAFADECYDDDRLIELLYNAPDAIGAESIILTIDEWDWVDGIDEFQGDTYFIRFEKDAEGIPQHIDGYRW